MVADSSIPELIKEIMRCRQDIKARLAELPPPIEAPVTSLRSICFDFVRETKEWIRGHFDKRDLVVEIGEADKKFLKDIKYSIAKFGLADHDQERDNLQMKCANDFLFEKHGMSFRH